MLYLARYLRYPPPPSPMLEIKKIIVSIFSFSTFDLKKWILFFIHGLAPYSMPFDKLLNHSGFAMHPLRSGSIPAPPRLPGSACKSLSIVNTPMSISIGRMSTAPSCPTPPLNPTTRTPSTLPCDKLRDHSRGAIHTSVLAGYRHQG